MRLTDSASRWLEGLRDHTSASHKALEHHPLLMALGAGEISAASYLRALRGLAAPQSAMETETVRFAQRRGALPDYHPLARTQWILNDLETLGAESFELMQPWPQCETPAAFIGMLYVREGSRFGAQVIAHRIKRQLPHLFAHTFFSRTSPPQWSAFIEKASQYADNCTDVAATANTVFTSIRTHLDSIAACA